MDNSSQDESAIKHETIIAPPLTEMTVNCNSCFIYIHDGNYEVCWYCTGYLCFDCWDKVGHCGHGEAYQTNIAAMTMKAILDNVKDSFNVMFINEGKQVFIEFDICINGETLTSRTEIDPFDDSVDIRYHVLNMAYNVMGKYITTHVLK